VSASRFYAVELRRESAWREPLRQRPHGAGLKDALEDDCLDSARGGEPAPTHDSQIAPEVAERELVPFVLKRIKVPEREVRQHYSVVEYVAIIHPYVGVLPQRRSSRAMLVPPIPHPLPSFATRRHVARPHSLYYSTDRKYLPYRMRT